MAVVVGTTMNIQVDNSSGTPVDVTGYANSIDFGFPVDMLDTTVFGSTQKSFMPGFGGGDDIAIQFRYDPTIEAQLSAISPLTSSSSVIVSPARTTTGSVKYIFETFLMNFTVNATPESIDQITTAFRKTGAYTRTTWA